MAELDGFTITVCELPQGADRQAAIDAALRALPEGSRFELHSGAEYVAQLGRNARDAGKYRMLRDTVIGMISAQDQG